MNVSYYLEQAKANAYYFDGFGVGTPKDEKSRSRFEQAMWYLLILAAEAGEI